MVKQVGIDARVADSVIWRNESLIYLGDHTAIDDFVVCTTALWVGEYSHISPHVSIIGGKKCTVRLEGYNFLATGTRIVAGSEDYVNGGLINPQIPEKFRLVTYSDIIFEKFSGTGANCVVLPGVVLAEGSVIGAGSTVTKSTEPWTVYVGSPARPVKLRNKDHVLEQYNAFLKSLSSK